MPSRCVLLTSEGVWFDCGEGTGHWRPHLCCLVCPGSVLCEYKVDHLAKPYIGPKIFLQIFRSVFSSVCYYFRLSTWQFWFHWDCVFFNLSVFKLLGICWNFSFVDKSLSVLFAVVSYFSFSFVLFFPLHPASPSPISVFLVIILLSFYWCLSRKRRDEGRCLVTFSYFGEFQVT